MHKPWRHWAAQLSTDNPFPQLLQKTGQIERTVDREFADEEAKYKTYVSPFLSNYYCLNNCQL